MTRNIEREGRSFAVLENGDALQTAVMRLAPGDESGPLANDHPESEQVLFVYEGEVEAEVAGKRFTLHAGDSTIVPKNAPHRFVNRSERPTLTFNVYAPRAY